MGKNQSILHQLKALALREYKDYETLGESLGESWALKKALAEDVSTPLTDEIYGEALKAGAIGGKLLGAGGGGFILFCVEPKKQDKVKEALKGLMHVPFRFSDKGSQIIFNGSP